MIRRTVLVLMIAALSVPPVSASATEIASELGTGFRVEKERLELGDVKAGTDAVATFVFHNSGEKPVRIIKAKPS